MKNRRPIRVVELTHEDRALLRRLIRLHAQRLGYGFRFHDDENFPGGPPDWTSQLRHANGLIRKLQEDRYAGGLSWPEDASSLPSTATARTAKR